MNDILISKNDITLRNTHLNILENKKWLNDDIVNFFGLFWFEKSNTSHYIPLWLLMLEEDVMKKEGSIVLKGIEKKNLIFFPMCYGQHFNLFILHKEKKDICCYFVDSKDGHPPVVLIKKIFILLHSYFQFEDKFDEFWKKIRKIKLKEKQKDCWSCGYYILYFMYIIHNSYKIKKTFVEYIVNVTFSKIEEFRESLIKFLKK